MAVIHSAIDIEEHAIKEEIQDDISKSQASPSLTYPTVKSTTRDSRKAKSSTANSIDRSSNESSENCPKDSSHTPENSSMSKDSSTSHETANESSNYESEKSIKTVNKSKPEDVITKPKAATDSMKSAKITAESAPANKIDNESAIQKTASAIAEKSIQDPNARKEVSEQIANILSTHQINITGKKVLDTKFCHLNRPFLEEHWAGAIHPHLFTKNKDITDQLSEWFSRDWGVLLWKLHKDDKDLLEELSKNNSAVSDIPDPRYIQLVWNTNNAVAACVAELMINFDATGDLVENTDITQGTFTELSVLWKKAFNCENVFIEKQNEAGDTVIVPKWSKAATSLGDNYNQGKTMRRLYNSFTKRKAARFNKKAAPSEVQQTPAEKRRRTSVEKSAGYHKDAHKIIDSDPADLAQFLNGDDGIRVCEDIFKTKFDREDNYDEEHWLRSYGHHFTCLNDPDLTDSDKLHEVLSQTQGIISKKGRKLLFTAAEYRVLRKKEREVEEERNVTKSFGSIVQENSAYCYKIGDTTILKSTDLTTVARVALQCIQLRFEKDTCTQAFKKDVMFYNRFLYNSYSENVTVGTDTPTLYSYGKTYAKIFGNGHFFEHPKKKTKNNAGSQ
eukprot:TRINITY_DN12973_c0_g1_i7.p1 TRINITY_DN12973_c0_g1~~TRINITY_DN12973_c0_g1_i7.p1  ORF type:complete len:664 (-),score=142.99 TRINITY_DN12973_c0_g1_i7:304-2157(-)